MCADSGRKLTNTNGWMVICCHTCYKISVYYQYQIHKPLFSPGLWYCYILSRFI